MDQSGNLVPNAICHEYFIPVDTDPEDMHAITNVS